MGGFWGEAGPVFTEEKFDKINRSSGMRGGEWGVFAAVLPAFKSVFVRLVFQPCHCLFFFVLLPRPPPPR